MLRFNVNGIIVQKLQEAEYQGIDGENWYLNYLDGDDYYKDYFDKHIDSNWRNQQSLDCCNDIGYIEAYGRKSRQIGVPFRLLLCATPKSCPLFLRDDTMLGKFIGYDYAYPGGSYYSCIKNDIVLRRIAGLLDMRLNEYGLIADERAMLDFINKRQQLTAQYPESMFEVGDFVIYKLWKLHSG
jgi:hypothetical protein